MPRHRRHRRKVGTGFKSFWGKAKKFLKKTKLLSTVGNALAPALSGTLGSIARAGTNYAKSQGYGRRRRIRRRRKGGALRPAGSLKRYGRGGSCGGSLAPVGAGRRRRRSKHHSSGKMNPRL